MAVKYKLIYFNMKTIAEPIRLLFHYANVEFEDVRVDREKDWPKLKPQMPWNEIPVLEEDGKQLSQSMTILRYLGRKFGLAGANEFETAKCNEYTDAILDIRSEFLKLFAEEDEAKKVEMKKNIQETVLPRMWKKFDEIIKKNGNTVLIGKDVTYADIYIAYMVDWLCGLAEFKDMQNYAELLAHQQKILGSPGIKEWIAVRPVTDY